MADSPRGYWHLGETAGTFADSSGNGNALAVAAGTPLRGQPALLTNQPEGCIQAVPSPAGYIGASSAAAAHNLGDVLSMECWIKRVQASDPGNLGILNKGANGYYLRLTTANKIELVKSNVAIICASTITITDLLPHHVVATKNGATSANIYVDGVDVTGTVTNQTLNDTSFFFQVGSAQGVEPANLFVDEVAIYATVLSAARVTAHYNAGLSPAGAPTTVTDLADVASAQSAGYTLTQRQISSGAWVARLWKWIYPPNDIATEFGGTGMDLVQATAQANALASLNRERRHRYTGNPNGTVIITNAHGDALVLDQT